MSPLDPRIALGGQPVQIQNPLETLQAVAQIQGVREQTEARRLAADEARQKAKDAAAVQQILTAHGGDIKAALPELQQVAPKFALELATEMEQANNQRAQAATHEMTGRRKELEFVADYASLVTDEASARRVSERLRRFSPEVTDLLPGLDEPYDPARWQGVRDLALTGAQRYDKSQANLKLFLEGKFQEGLGGALSDAANQQQWDQTIETFLDLGGPPSVAQMFGAYSPENVTRAGHLAITPAKATELAGQAETRAQTAAHQRVLEGQGAERVAIARQRAAQAGAAQSGAGGAEGGAVKLSAAQQEDVATMLTVEQLVGDIEAIDKQGNGFPGVGPVEGRFMASARGSGGPTGETLRNTIGNIQGTIAKLRGGTSFTPSEQALLDTYTPTTTDTDAAIRTKLKSLVAFIQKKRANTLRVAAGDYTLPAQTGTTTPADTANKKKIGRFEIVVE